MDGKPGGTSKGSASEGWQLSPLASHVVSPGTVLGVGAHGKPFVVDRLPVTVKSTPILGGLSQRVQAARSAVVRVFGRVHPGLDGRGAHDLTLELPEAESESVDDDELERHVGEFLPRFAHRYRPDTRYFVVRGAISAPPGAQGAISAPAKLRLPASAARAFAHKTRVAVLLDEIRPARPKAKAKAKANANVKAAAPTLTLARAEAPLPDEPTVPWVTSVVDPVEAVRTRTIVVARPVQLTTSIGMDAGDAALEAIGISREMLENATIQFKVVVDGALARPQSGDAAAAATLTSPELHFEEAPALFGFRIEAAAAGPVTLRVILYLNGRPTLRQKIALTAVESSASASEASAPAPAPGEAPPAPAPLAASSIDGHDLLSMPAPLVVLALGSYEDGYAIDLIAEGRRVERPAVPASEAADLAHKTIDWRTRLIQLSGDYGAGEPDELATATPDALRAFARIGVEIHKALFGPRHGREDLDRIAGAIAQIPAGAAQRPLLLLTAERLPLPWGVVYDRPLDDATPVDPAGFWGHRFLIERIAPAVFDKVPPRSLRAPGDASAQLVPCLNLHLDEQQHVEAAARQKHFFEELTGAGLTCVSALKTRAELERWLPADRGECRLIYFFCHADSAKTVDEEFFQSRQASDTGTWLDLDANEALRIDVEWLGSTRKVPFPGQPLVFLNACCTTAGDREFQSPFLTQFIREFDARTLIGSDWKIPTAFADAFSRRFLRRFLTGGTSLVQAFTASCDEFMAAGNPFSLIYAIYGRSDIVITEEHAP